MEAIQHIIDAMKTDSPEGVRRSIGKARVALVNLHDQKLREIMEEADRERDTLGRSGAMTSMERPRRPVMDDPQA